MKGKIFNAQEVQAIIAGTKTMFREVIKNQTPPDFVCDTKPSLHYSNNRFFLTGQSYDWWFEKCPYQVGQKIFVKEEIAHGGYFGACFVYSADGANSNKMWQTHWSRHFRPAQQMRQEHSRLTLEITDVKVERLGEISEEDCWKEGFKTDYKILPHGIFKKDASKFFTENWNATHKKPEEKFEANPFVWVVDFKINK